MNKNGKKTDENNLQNQEKKADPAYKKTVETRSNPRIHKIRDRRKFYSEL